MLRLLILFALLWSATALASPAPAVATTTHEAALFVGPPGHPSLVGEIGFRNSAYDKLLSKYNYNWLYPQAFAIDEVASELFILRGASRGANKWAWIETYDLGTLALKTVFTTGQRWSESLILRKIGSRRFLYTIGDSAVIRVDITELPESFSRLAPNASYANGQSMMAFDGTHFAVQDPRQLAATRTRNRFTLYDANFKRAGELVLPEDRIGALGKNADRFPKMQGLSFYAGNYVIGSGAAYLPGVHDPDSVGKLQGVQVFSRAGDLLWSSLIEPEQMRRRLEAILGYSPSCVENEGVAAGARGLYSLWVTLGPSERAKAAKSGKGLVLLQENVSPGRGH